MKIPTRHDKPLALRCGWLLLGLLLPGPTWAAAGRTVGDVRPIPPDAWLVLSVPDFRSTWNALAATPVYEQSEAFLETSGLKALSGYKRLLEQKRQMEAELGFPLTPATLAEIIGGFDFVSLPGEKGDRHTLSVFLFRVADTPRFRRLVELVKRRMGDAAAALNPSKPALPRETYRGIEIVSLSEGRGLAVAELAPDRFAMADGAKAIRRIIDQIHGTDDLSQQAGFRRAVSGLTEPDPHVFFYLNSSPVAASLRSGHLPGFPIGGMLRMLRDEITLAATFRVEKEAIRFESFLPFSTPEADPLAALYRHYPPGKLRSLDFVSSSPLLLVARNTLDGPALLELLRPMILGAAAPAPSAAPSAEERLKRAEEDFRRQMGFGLTEDLAPAIGPEFFVSLEQLRFDSLLPLPIFDMVIGIQIRDAERMKRIVSGLEAFIERQTTGGEAGDRPTSFSLRQVTYQGKTIKSFLLPQAPAYSIGYVQTDGFLLLGLGGESLQRAIDRADRRPASMTGGGLHERLQPFLHSQANELFLLNIARMVAVGREVINRLAKGDQKWAGNARQIGDLLNCIGRIGGVGASTAGSEKGLHTRGVLLFVGSPSPSKSKTAGKP